MMRIRSIRLRLTFRYTLAVGFLTVLLAAVAFYTLRVLLLNNIDTTLRRGSIVLGESLSDYGRKDTDDPQSLYELTLEGDEFYVDVIDEEAQETGIPYFQLREFSDNFDSPMPVIARTSNMEEMEIPLPEEAYKALDAGPYFSNRSKLSAIPSQRILTSLVYDRDERPYIIQLAIPLAEIQVVLRGLFVIFMILFTTLILSTSLLGHFFMKRAFAPVRSMVKLARRISAEDLSLRLTPTHSRDEIGELADTLNEMISRLESSFERIKQFSADAAHEIKTPLTQIQCNAEVALRRRRQESEYKRVITGILADARILEHVVNDLLFLATTDLQNLSFSFTTIPLNEAFLEAFEETHPLIREKKLSVIFQEIQAVNVRGNRGMVKRLINNLIVNAIQYTPYGGSIEFSLTTNGQYAEWQISDTGIGIDEHSLQRIFDRFYRADPSRSPGTGGSGLGLAIVKRIVEIHSGSISVESKPGVGTTFSVLLIREI